MAYRKTVRADNARKRSIGGLQDDFIASFSFFPIYVLISRLNITYIGERFYLGVNE